jgi:hypothetical protein
MWGIVKRPAMRVGFSSIAVLLALAASAGRSSAMTADGDKRLMLIESPANHLSKSVKEHLRTAIGEVAARQGLKVVPSQTLPDKLLRCDLPGCLPQIAAASGATLVLRVEAKYAKESFKLGIELWNSDEGKLLGREDRDCPICDEQDLWGTAALLVQGLLDRSLHEAKPAPTEPTREISTVPAAASPATTTVTAAKAAPAHPGNLVGYAGLALTVAGASLLATGIYYLVVDGRAACEHCDLVRDTSKYGLPMTLGGGVAAAAGVSLLLWRFWPSAPAVSFGPSGVLVAGRFQ